MVIALAMCCKVNIVEVVYRKYFRCLSVVGGFETSNIHMEDFVVLKGARRYASENTEECEDEDGES